MNEELDSQLSAMFDDELPQGECELLARRLSRDGELKARWERYALIGAAVRAEPGVRLDGRIARGVGAALSAEPALAAETPAAPRHTSRHRAWMRPLAGAAVAASVATVAILWLRGHGPATGASLQAAAPPTATAAPIPVVAGEARGDSYVVPRRAGRRVLVVPNTELANYVVAHSEVSSPMARRSMLSALMAGTGAAVGMDAPQPPEEMQDDATTSP